MKKLGLSMLIASVIGMNALAAAAFGAEPASVDLAGLSIAGPVLIVTDLDRSLRFYTEGLGLEVANRLPGNPGPGATVVAPGGGRAPFILLRQREARPNRARPVEIGSGFSRVMLSVADAKAVEARLRSAGFAPTVPNARNIFFVTDPDGYRYEIIQRQPAK